MTMKVLLMKGYWTGRLFYTQEEQYWSSTWPLCFCLLQLCSLFLYVILFSSRLQCAFYSSASSTCLKLVTPSVSLKNSISFVCYNGKWSFLVRQREYDGAMRFSSRWEENWVPSLHVNCHLHVSYLESPNFENLALFNTPTGLEPQEPQIETTCFWKAVYKLLNVSILLLWNMLWNILITIVRLEFFLGNI